MQTPAGVYTVHVSKNAVSNTNKHDMCDTMAVDEEQMRPRTLTAGIPLSTRNHASQSLHHEDSSGPPTGYTKSSSRSWEVVDFLPHADITASSNPAILKTA